MKKNFYIDSIDCDVAHILAEDSQKSYTFPVALLPKGIKEDQWFSLETSKLEQKGQNLKNEIENMFDLLEQGKHI